MRLLLKHGRFVRGRRWGSGKDVDQLNVTKRAYLKLKASLQRFLIKDPLNEDYHESKHRKDATETGVRDTKDGLH